jgi:tRNA(Arg) A34 adenosine deaminase TadA
MLLRAIKASRLSTCNFKHGAVVTRGGRVIGIGVNSYRNDINYIKDTSNLSFHAEAMAIKAAGDCRGATIYIARTNKRGHTRHSAPCPRCRKAIIESGIKHIVYTGNE